MSFTNEFEKIALSKKDMAKRVSEEMDVDKKEAMKALAEKGAEMAIKKGKEKINSQELARFGSKDKKKD